MTKRPVGLLVTDRTTNESFLLHADCQFAHPTAELGADDVRIDTPPCMPDDGAALCCACGRPLRTDPAGGGGGGALGAGSGLETMMMPRALPAAVALAATVVGCACSDAVRDAPGYEPGAVPEHEALARGGDAAPRR